MIRVLIFILFFVAQISIVVFVAVRASKMDELMLVCETEVRSAKDKPVKTRNILPLNDKEFVLANSADLSLKGAAGEIVPGQPLSNVEKFLFGVHRRIRVVFSGTTRRSSSRDFSTDCVLESGR